MSTIILQTKINAPIERCFNLSTSIDSHKISASKSKEQAIEGITEGLIKLNETVTWKANYFGLWHETKVNITGFKKPTNFTDEMINGTFKFLKYEHKFVSEGNKTIMTDTIEFA